jgi:hypothetical protein
VRNRLAAVGLGIVLGANGAAAQPQSLPPSQFPQIPLAPQGPSLPPSNFPAAPGGFSGPQSQTAPGLLPSSILPNTTGIVPPAPPSGAGGFPPGAAPGAAGPGLPVEMPLPQPEQKVALSAKDVQVKRAYGGWEVWSGQHELHNFGDNEAAARDVARVLRDLRATEWVTIGTKPVLEYGLINGRPPLAGAAPLTDGKNESGVSNVQHAGGFGATVAAAGAKVVQPIDLRSTRVEAIRGAWCVRDDDNLLFNFGPDKGSADQAAAVIHKYGFNRVGVLGTPAQPVMSYLYVSLEQEPQKFLAGPALVNAQIDAMTRTGIPVPGVGYTGEMVKIDPHKVEARKDGGDWVVAAGSEVLGRFGPTEWAARDAARTVRDANFNEFCKLGGTSALTFFLHDGKAPNRAPTGAQERAFDPTALKVQQLNGKWSVTEGNRPLFDVSGPQEGDVVVRVVKAFGFDQVAHLTAGGPKGGVTYFIKGR